jgi:hypothetical protein
MTGRLGLVGRLLFVPTQFPQQFMPLWMAEQAQASCSHRKRGWIMTQRKNDKTPTPSGGRAAERRRQFEEARGIPRPKPKAPRDPDELPPEGQQQSDETIEKKPEE